MSETGLHDWIQVESTSFDPNEKFTRRGVEFQVFLSPYDQPQAVRGSFDKLKDRFVIELRYIADEETDRVESDRHIALFVGRQSQRLRRIEVDVRAIGALEVALSISHAIDELPRLLHSERIPNANFVLAKRVISAKQERLLEALSTS